MTLETEQRDGVVVVKLRVGENDVHRTLASLKGEIGALTEGGQRQVVLDLSELDFMDSKGFGALVGCSRLLEERGGTFLACGLGLRLAETLHIVRLNQVIPFRLTLEDSLRDAVLPEEGAADFAALISGNPSLADVREWWGEHGGTIASKPRPAAAFVEMGRKQQPPAKKPSEFLSDWESPDIARLHSLIEGNHNLHDWMQALYLFSEAKRLSQRYDIPFNAEMSFKEFLSRLADSLSTPKKSD